MTGDYSTGGAATKIFKRRSLKWILLWMLAVYPLCIVMCVAIFKETGFSFVSGFIAICVLIVGIAGANALLSMSDIIIDDVGISRSFFGMVWRTIPWGDIKIIRSFRIPSFGVSKSGSLRAFEIYSDIQPDGKPNRRGKIGFTEGFDDMGHLIELINCYQSKTGFQIEVSENGASTPATSL